MTVGSITFEPILYGYCTCPRVWHGIIPPPLCPSCERQRAERAERLIYGPMRRAAKAKRETRAMHPDEV